MTTVVKTNPIPTTIPRNNPGRKGKGFIYFLHPTGSVKSDRPGRFDIMPFYRPGILIGGFEGGVLIGPGAPAGKVPGKEFGDRSGHFDTGENNPNHRRNGDGEE